MHDEPEIQRVTRVQAVRMRPSMYLGGTDIKGLHHMVEEVLDHALDFSLAGKCNRIDISLRKDNEICIRDYGPGTSVERFVFVREEISILEAILLHHNYFGDRLGLGPYYVAGGLHGIGVSVINMLSEWMYVENRYDGYLWQTDFKAGIQTNPLERLRPLGSNEASGTAMSFKPDFTILERNEFDFDTIAHRCSDLSWVIPNLSLHLRDERIQPAREEIFLNTDYISSLASKLIRRGSSYLPFIVVDANLSMKWDEHDFARQGTAELKCAFAFSVMESYGTDCYVNSIKTPAIGTQVDGCRKGILQFLNEVGAHVNSMPIKWNDVETHVTSVINLFCMSPQFPSQSRLELLNPEMVEPIAMAVYEAFTEFAEAQPDQMKKILEIFRDSRNVK